MRNGFDAIEARVMLRQIEGAVRIRVRIVFLRLMPERPYGCIHDILMELV